jgi:hypothetical protein
MRLVFAPRDEARAQHGYRARTRISTASRDRVVEEKSAPRFASPFLGVETPDFETGRENP